MDKKKDVFQQTIDIPIGTCCAPLLVDLFLNAYEVHFWRGLLQKQDRKLPQNFNSSFRYIGDVWSQNNSRFGDHLYCIYPIELEVNDTTENQK